MNQSLKYFKKRIDYLLIVFIKYRNGCEITIH